LRYEQVEGRRAVLEALHGERAVYELLLAEGMPPARVLDDIPVSYTHLTLPTTPYV
jgi:hypothetical protein